MTESEIENLLRKAPRPAAPPGLKDQLAADITLPRAVRLQQPEQSSAARLWRRWFPALSFGVLLLGCLIVLGVQRNQLLELRRESASRRAGSRTRAEATRGTRQAARRSRPTPGRGTGIAGPARGEPAFASRARGRRRQGRCRDGTGPLRRGQRPGRAHRLHQQHQTDWPRRPDVGE